VSLSSRSHFAGGKQTVNPAGGAQIEDRFAGTQLRQGAGIPAAQRRSHCFFRKARGFILTVEVGGNGVIVARLRRAAAAGLAAARDRKSTRLNSSHVAI